MKQLQPVVYSHEDVRELVYIVIKTYRRTNGGPLEQVASKSRTLYNASLKTADRYVGEAIAALDATEDLMGTSIRSSIAVALHHHKRNEDGRLRRVGGASHSVQNVPLKKVDRAVAVALDILVEEWPVGHS